MKLATLNKQETKWINDLFGDIYDDEELKQLINEECKLKTFLRELRKIEKKHGYEPNKANIKNAISYFGEDRYEVITEEYCNCFGDDFKRSAEVYFETYY